MSALSEKDLSVFVEMGKKSRQIAEKKFSKDAILNRFIALV